jgi:hypothetical protein
MKKQASSSNIFLIILIVLLLALVGCYKIWVEPEKEEIKTVSGETFYISLNLIQGECGWEPEFNKSYLQLIEKECDAEAEEEVFSFFAIRPGRTTLSLEFINQEDGDSKDVKKYSVKIRP